MYECGRCRKRLQISAVCALLQAFDEVKIGQKPPVAIDVGFAVGCGKNGANKFDS
jgi:hypothetical protein